MCGNRQSFQVDPACNVPLGQRCIMVTTVDRGLNVAVGPTLYNGWYFHGLNVAVGPTLGQCLKASANMGQCASVSPTKI